VRARRLAVTHHRTVSHAITAVIIGRSAMTANWAISSRPGEIPPASSRLSSLVCLQRRASARFRGPPKISGPGNSSLGPKRMSGADAPGFTRPRSTLSKRTVEIHPDYAPARSLLAFCLFVAAHMGGSTAITGCSLVAKHAVRLGRPRRLRFLGQIALGYLALMEKRTEESIAAFVGAVLLNPIPRRPTGILATAWHLPGADARR